MFHKAKDALTSCTELDEKCNLSGPGGFRFRSQYFKSPGIHIRGHHIII